MPLLYLSPSTQEGNLYVTGQSEEYVMNQLADRMMPFLRASGIDTVRNTPDMTATSSMQQSNAGNYDLHLALHSNAAPPQQYGTYRGTDVYYYPGSVQGQRAAELIANNLRAIYPIPGKVRTLPNSELLELRRTRAPAVFLELAYHDNREDALWIQDNLETIAENLVFSLTEYFRIPFFTPCTERTGRVTLQSGSLNVRERPSMSAPVLFRASNGQQLTVLGSWDGWYLVRNQNRSGYARSEYITIL